MWRGFLGWKSVISGNSREKWWYRTLHQPNSREKQIIKVLPTENVNYALDSRNVNYIRCDRDIISLISPFSWPRENGLSERVATIKEKRTTFRSLCVKVVRKLRNLLIFSLLVVLGRIELPTHGFSVHCSTIWATAAIVWECRCTNFFWLCKFFIIFIKVICCFVNQLLNSRI